MRTMGWILKGIMIDGVRKGSCEQDAAGLKVSLEKSEWSTGRIITFMHLSPSLVCQLELLVENSSVVCIFSQRNGS